MSKRLRPTASRWCLKHSWLWCGKTGGERMRGCENCACGNCARATTEHGKHVLDLIEQDSDLQRLSR